MGKRSRRKKKPTPAQLEAAWEALCDGCGKCCSIYSVGRGGRNAGCGVACPSLDAETNQCKVYEDRHKVEMCLPVRPNNVMRLHKRGILPDSCAYVRAVQGKPRLPKILVAGAKLLPFKLADPDLQQKYLLRREEWLSNVSDDQPTSGHQSPEDGPSVADNPDAVA